MSEIFLLFVILDSREVFCNTRNHCSGLYQVLNGSLCYRKFYVGNSYELEIRHGTAETVGFRRSVKLCEVKLTGVNQSCEVTGISNCVKLGDVWSYPVWSYPESTVQAIFVGRFPIIFLYCVSGGYPPHSIQCLGLTVSKTTHYIRNCYNLDLVSTGG